MKDAYDIYKEKMDDKRCDEANRRLASDDKNDMSKKPEKCDTISRRVADSDKSPREFWVRPRRIGKGPTWNASENPSAYSGYNDSVHLIEHSAYLAVKQELETIKINRNYHVENYQGVCKELEASRLQSKDLASALEDLINHGYLHAGEKAKETLKKWKQK